MGIIYELLKVPERDKKKFLHEMIRRETVEKLKAQKADALKTKSDK